VNRDVTEPERLRRELGESEEKYRNLVELSPDAILIHQDGVIVFANPAAAALVGTGTPADLNGRRIMEIVHPGGREDVAWNIAADLRGEESPLTTVGILRPDGTTVVVQGRGSMIPFGGRPAVQVVLRDVTDEKCAEAALRASEDRLRSVLEISLDAVYRRDLVADRYDYVSPVIEAITGLSADEFARLEIQEVLDRIHPDDRAVVQAAIEEGAEALSGTVEYRLRHRDGSYRWVSDYFVVQVDAEGRPVLRGGVLRDVTQRRRIEDALRESEERLRLAQEGADVAVWDWDVLTGEQTHTSGLPRLYGADGRIGRYDLWREHVHPDDIKRLESERDAALARGEPFDIEFRVVHPTGEVRWLAAIGRGHYDETGTLVRVLGVNLDITERKETELRIARYANEVERSNEELQRFAYVASHDLQEPLRSIISFSQLLERRYRGKLDQDADDYIGFIVEGGLRMQALIRDLLQFSRVETQARPLAPTDAREVVADVLRAMRTLLRETGATVMVDDLPVVKADGSQLEQVFSNLIANAIKYRRPGVPPEVRISATRKGGWWEFSVADNGIGIEAEYYDLIFEMFRRLHTHDKYDGTGIGLAVVQRIVARHGGTVRVESTLGEGSTFFFTLPAA
jgi:PAS domain S-box-containing protein